MSGQRNVGIFVERSFRMATPAEVYAATGRQLKGVPFVVETRMVCNVHATKGKRDFRIERRMYKRPYGGVPKNERRYVHHRIKERYMDKIQVRP